MVNEARIGTGRKNSQSAKRPWMSPEVEIAPARDAKAFAGPPGGVDYGFYS